MKKSKIIVLLLAMVMILAISAASAAEEIDDSSDSDLQAVEEAPLEEAASDVDVVGATDDTDVVADPGDGNNFTSLEYKISSSSKSFMFLDKDYTRAEGDHEITISKDFAIFGSNTYKLDANNLGGIFKVNSGVTFVLDGVTLVNGNSDYGAAVYNDGGELIIQDCVFQANNATMNGGAIYNTGTLTIDRSTFIENTATYRGGAIWSSGTANIKDSSFDKNDISYRVKNADNGGAAIFSKGDLTVDNSRFTNNLVGYVVRSGDDNSPQLVDGVVLSAGVAVINNSYFENNSGTYGGAITAVPIASLGSTSTSLTVENSEFVNNLAYNGAAINVNADAKGKATYSIKNCTFIGNNAKGIGSSGSTSAGGAIALARDTDGTITDSRFYNNTATVGGAIDVSASKNSLKVSIDNCEFINNTATDTAGAAVGGAIRIGGRASGDNMVVSVENSNFINNAAADGGSAIYNSGTLALSKNTVDAGAEIKNSGTITSQVTAVVTADKANYRIENITLTATLTDDNGNAINDTSFKFIFNTPAGLAAIPATFNGNNYTVKFTPTKDGEYNVTTDCAADVTNAAFTVYRTLTDLADKIAAANGNPVILDGDYTYNAAYDSAIATAGGIAIDNDVTIDGKGYTIDAKNATRIFNVKADMNITNVTLTNGKTTGLGAAINIATAGNNVRVTYTTFTNNAAKYGSGICDDVGDGSNVYVDNCIFDSNYNTVTGTVFCGAPAIYSWGSLVVNNSVFNNNGLYGLIDGDVTNAAVTTQGDGKIYNSNFTNNRANKGGAICSNRNSKVIDLIVDNCRFINNTGYDGGAVLVNTKSNADIKNSYFENNFAYGFGSEGYTAAGGAICVVGAKYADIANCIFKENKVGVAANSSGGAISIENTNVDISDCTFESNSAIKCGGAIDISNKVSTTAREVTISNCNFTNNSAEFGDAIMLRESKTELNVSGSNFEDNGAETDYSVYNMVGTLKLAGNTIDNMIYSDSTITSQIKVTTDNVTVHYGEKVNLTATITDDSGNLVNCTNFYFVVNTINYGPAKFNAATKKYEFEQEFTLQLGTYEITIVNADIVDLTYVEKGNLTAVPKKGTYSDLQAQIDALAPGETLELTYDFAYDAGYDADRFPNGVIINKALAIIGNDHFISGADTVRIFRIGTFANADIRGVVFKNGKTDKGGALFVAGKLSIDNCTFVNNTATVSGHDIHIMTTSVVVVNGEESYNYLLNDPDSSLNKYYADNPREDGIDANGNPVHDETTPIVGHSWESAITTWMDNITINGTTYTWQDGYSKFPWILINLDDYTGPIVFKYDGEIKFVWDVSNKQRGVISILEDLKMPDYTLTYQYGTVRDKVFDPSLLTVEYNGTSSGKAVIMLSAPGDSVIIKNSVFDSDGYSIYNLGTLSLENNTVKGGIYNNGTIISDVNANVLDNKTVNVTTSTYELNATLTDDKGNNIYDPELIFTVNGEKIADKPDYSNGLYTVTSNKFTTDYPSYIINLAADNEFSLAAKTGVIINLLRGTFTDLQARIEASNGDLVLPYNFTYNAEFDGDKFLNGIALTKNIVGNGSTIDANGANVNIFVINNGATVKLSNLTITGVNRSADNMYGAVVNHGSLTVEDATFKDNNINKVTGTNGGAAIFNDGAKLTVLRSTFINNTAPWKGSTGAISSWAASGLLIKDSYFEANVARWGGAVEIESLNQQELAIDNCTFYNNTGYQGGALAINDGARYVNVTGCTFDANTFQGPAGIPTTGANGAAISVGLNVPVTLEISDSIIKNNVGDDSDHSAGVGIRLADYATGIITNCTFENNGNGHSSAINVGTYNNRTGGLTLKDSTFINSIADNNIMVFINPNVKASIENCTFENDGANYTIYTMGTLSLSNNTIHAVRAIRNVNGAVISEVNATLIGGKEVEAALGDTVIANATLTDDNGNVIYDADFNITIDGVELKTTFADGIYTAKYIIETAGDKNVSTNYAATNVISGKYLVDKANVTEFTVTVVDILKGKNATVYVTLVGVNDIGLNSTVTVIVNNKEYPVAVENGTGNITIEDLAHGKYPVVAMFNGNSNYNSEINSTIFYVKGQSELNITELTVAEYGDEIEITINLTDSEGNPISGIVVIDNVYKVIVYEDGIGTFVIDNQPDVGKYNFQAVYDGDDDYFGCLTLFNVTVTPKVIDPKDVVVEIPIINEYGDAIPVTITSPVDGTYTVNINGTTVQVEVINRTGNATVKLDKPGIYNATVNIDEEEYTLDTITTDDFEYLVTPKFNVVITGTYPDATVTIEGTDGNYTVFIDEGHTFEMIVKDGVGSANTTGLFAGDYTALVTFNAHDEYYGGYKDVNFTVAKAASSVTIDPITNVVYANPVVITFNIVNETGVGEILITDENGKSYDCEINGSTVTAILPAGEYTISIHNGEDAIYNESEETATFTVYKAEALNITYDGDLAVMGGGTVNITVASDATGYVIIDNNGVTLYGELENGKFTFDINNLTAGDYEITVTYYGDDNYNKTEATKVLPIPKAVVVPEITDLTAEILGGQNATFTVTMSNNFANGNVSVYVDGVLDQVVVLDADYANATVVISGLGNGTHTIVVQYNGNDNYEAVVNATASVTVEMAASKVTIDPIAISYDGDVVITFTIENETDHVTINIIDVNDPEKSIDFEQEDGIITVKDLPAGTYKVNIHNGESDFYYESEASATFYVCDNVVTNDTFFNYFDENGTLLEDVPFDELIFQGEFAGLGVKIITIDRPIDITGEDAVLNDIALSIKAEDIKISDLTLIADSADFNLNRGAAILVVESGVTLDGVTIEYNAPSDVDAYAIYVAEANEFTLISSEIIFNGNADNTHYQYGMRIADSNDVLIKDNVITTSLPTRDVDWMGQGIDADLVLAIGVQNGNNIVITENTIKNDVMAGLSGGYPTLDTIMVNGATDIEISYNDITQTDEVNTGSAMYNVVDLYAFTGVVDHNNITVKTNTGVPASGTAYPIQMNGPFTATVSYNNLTTVSNGPTAGVMTANWGGYADLTLTNNIIDVTGYAGSNEYDLTTGVELQVNTAKVYNNTIIVGTESDYDDANNIYGISNAQDNVGGTFDIQDNEIYSDGKYAVYLQLTDDSTVKGNYLIAHELYGDAAVDVPEECIVYSNYPQDLNIIVTVENCSVADPVEIAVTTNPLFSGKVIISITDQNDIEIDIVDGEGGEMLSSLPAGKYTVTASYAGDKFFKADENSTDLEVFRHDENMTIVAGDAIIDEPLVVNITLGFADGNVTVIIDGNIFNVVLTDGFGNFTIPKENMTAGNHSIIAIFGQTDDYEAASAVYNFTVEKAEDYNFDVNLTIDEISAGENATINITLPDDANGKVTVSVDGKEVTFEDVVNGTATVTIPADAFTAGRNNTISVTYSDDKYGETTVNKDIAVNKLPFNFTASADNIESGENATVVVNLPAGANGNATVILQGKEYPVVDGKAIIEKLAEGNYTADVIYVGDSVYADNTTTVSFEVTKVKISPEEAFNISSPENSTSQVISVNLPEDATGYLLLDIDGKQTHVPLVDGKANVTVPNLPEGTYNATITYTGDDKYDSVTTTKEINVTSNVPDDALTIPENASSDEPTTYSISLPSNATGYLEVDVDGTKYVAPLVNGSASVSVPALSEGNHNVTVTYTGDDNYSPVTKATTLSVKTPAYNIAENKNVNVIYSAKASYKVLITRDGKAVGAGESVAIKFNGKTYTVKTDAKGYATLNLNTKVKVKSYAITATYKGVTVKNTVKVKHLIKASNKKIKKSKKVNKIKVKTNKVNGKYLKGKKLTLKIKGKKVKAKINKKGVAIFKLKKSITKKLKAGKKYKYTVTYGKDKVTKKVKVKR